MSGRFTAEASFYTVNINGQGARVVELVHCLISHDSSGVVSSIQSEIPHQLLLIALKGTPAEA